MTLRNPVRNPPSIIARAAQAAQIRQAVNLVRTLSRAQEILSDSSSWTRGALARNVLRVGVLPTSDVAHSWSASGAVVLAASEVLGAFASRSEREQIYDLAIRALWGALPEEHPRSQRMHLDVDGFNDYFDTEHEDVIALFECAIASARSAPAITQVELTRP